MKAFATLATAILLAQAVLAQNGGAPGMQPSSGSPPASSPPTSSPPSQPPAQPPTSPPTSSPPSPTPGTPPTPSPTTTAAAATSSSSSSSSSSSGSGSGPSALDVLTFAYNLECLEGQFYNCAAFGKALPTSSTGGGPAPSSCTKANLNSTVATYAAELAQEEAAHVLYLYNAIKAAGGSPVCPFVNIDTAFEAAAEAAFNMPGTPLNPTFNPYANDVFFLHGAFLFEDLGASAYLGAQGLLLSNATLNKVAGQVGNAESYHSALIRTLLYQILNTTPAYNSSVQQITSAIVAVLNKLSGSPQLKYELTNSMGSSIANVDSSGFVPVATPAQVLKVVTLGASAGNGGGFFPNNLVGNVKN